MRVDLRDEIQPLHEAEFNQFVDNSKDYATRLVMRHFAGDYASVSAYMDAAKDQSPDDLALGLYLVSLQQAHQTAGNSLTFTLFKSMAEQVDWSKILDIFNYYTGR